MILDEITRDIVNLQAEINRLRSQLSTGLMQMGGETLAVIASDAISVRPYAFYIVEPETGTTDDLSTINGGLSGKMIGLRVDDNANTVTLKDGVNNISLPDGDIDLDHIAKLVLLVYDGDQSLWILAGNGSSPSTPFAGTFLALTDAPASYVGQANKVVSVNAGEAALEFTTPTTIDNINFGALNALTIASGEVTVPASGSFFSIAAESGTADDLDTINGGSDGDMIVLRPDSGDTITVTDNVGNLQLSGNFAMDDPADKITLIYDDAISKWCEITSSGNA